MARADVFRALGGLDAAYGSATVFAFLIRALDQGVFINRIAEVLGVYPGARPIGDLTQRRRVLAQSRTFGRFVAEMASTPGKLSLKRAFMDAPPVSILIKHAASAGDPASGRLRLGALFERLKATAWPADKLEVIIDGGVAEDFAGRAFRREAA